MLVEWLWFAAMMSPATVYGFSIALSFLRVKVVNKADLRSRRLAVEAKRQSKLSAELYDEIHQTPAWWDKQYAELLAKVEPLHWDIRKTTGGYGVMKLLTDEQKKTKHDLAQDIMRWEPAIGRDRAMTLASNVARGIPGAMNRVKEVLDSHRHQRELCNECEYVEQQTYGGNTWLHVTEPCWEHQEKFNKFSLTA